MLLQPMSSGMLRRFEGHTVPDGSKGHSIIFRVKGLALKMKAPLFFETPNNYVGRSSSKVS